MQRAGFMTDTAGHHQGMDKYFVDFLFRLYEAHLVFMYTLENVYSVLDKSLITVYFF